MTKEDKEKFLFQMFQSNYKGLPTGTVEFDDKPDVIVTTQTGETIGVELTECIYDETLMAKSEYQIKFNEKVVAEFECLLPFRFLLDIELDSTIPLKQNQIGPTIQGIIKVCLDEFGNLKPYESRYVEQLEVDWNEGPIHIQQHFLKQGFRKLPRGIASIEVSRFDNLTKSHHLESKGGVVPNFTQEHLDRILTNKEKALKDYKTCSQQWLVIGEGGDFYSYIDKIEISEGFATNFDKVFMCRRWNSEVVVLK